MLTLEQAQRKLAALPPAAALAQITDLTARNLAFVERAKARRQIRDVTFPVVSLQTRRHPKTGCFQIKVRRAWRQNSRLYDQTCFPCHCQGRHIPLNYYGQDDFDGVMEFWGVCPSCGWQTEIFWPGKKREQRPTGGNGYNSLAQRRRLSGY